MAWPNLAEPFVRKLAVVPVVTYEALAGEYEVRPGFRVLVTSDAGRLLSKPPAGPGLRSCRSPRRVISPNPMPLSCTRSRRTTMAW
jgi:hypothetical protein